MGILTFIFSVLALLVGAFIILGVVGTIFNYKKLEEENKELKKKVGK